MKPLVEDEADIVEGWEEREEDDEEEEDPNEEGGEM